MVNAEKTAVHYSGTYRLELAEQRQGFVTAAEHMALLVTVWY